MLLCEWLTRYCRCKLWPDKGTLYSGGTSRRASPPALTLDRLDNRDGWTWDRRGLEGICSAERRGTVHVLPRRPIQPATADSREGPGIFETLFPGCRREL